MSWRHLISISIKQIPNGKWSENCYIVNSFNKDTLIIDPGGDDTRIINYIGNNNLNAIAVFATHAHYDHIGSIKTIKDKFSIPLFLHSKDKRILKTANLYATLFDGIGQIPIPSIDHYFDQIEKKEIVESFSIEVMHTPGHTWGSICILIEDCLFSGDTIFKGKIGRTDLPGGDEQALKTSLKLISKLPKQTIIFPGHGAPTTIGNELKYNKSFIEAIK